ncbi:conserved hypothetical protein [Ricinus communis]|uniref:Uncharacterized protein n=1 Tax=Ricinus communis TaxID=3988 RepID=B9RRG3_RICCO|nr:conserved hypothetical protein [Ricinus communis]
MSALLLLIAKKGLFNLNGYNHIGRGNRGAKKVSAVLQAAQAAIQVHQLTTQNPRPESTKLKWRNLVLNGSFQLKLK